MTIIVLEMIKYLSTDYKYHVVPNSNLVCLCTKEPVSAGQWARGQRFGEPAKGEASKCWLSKQTFSCLFVPADLLCALFSCSAPDLLAGGFPLRQRQMHPPLLAVRRRQRLRGRLRRTGLSWVLLCSLLSNKHAIITPGQCVTHVNRCDALVRGRDSRGQRPLTFALKSSWCSVDLWNCVNMCIHTPKTTQLLVEEECRYSKGHLLAGTLHRWW